MKSWNYLPTSWSSYFFHFYSSSYCHYHLLLHLREVSRRKERDDVIKDSAPSLPPPRESSGQSQLKVELVHKLAPNHDTRLSLSAPSTTSPTNRQQTANHCVALTYCLIQPQNAAHPQPTSLRSNMVDSTPLIPGSSDSDTKQGQRILGCCDSRRAVIVINSIALALSSLGLLLILPASDQVLIVFIIVSCICIIFYIIVICSAVNFQYVAVIVAIVWEVINVILVIVNSMFIDSRSDLLSSVLSILLYLLNIHAACVYIFEVRNGIMSRENHSRETYSW